MTVEPVNIDRIAEEFSLNSDYTRGNDVKVTGKSGAVHKFDLLLTSKRDQKLKIAVLRGKSGDLVNDIMKFNSIASDCGIDLKALVVDKDLDETEINLTRMYNIVTIDQRQVAKRKTDVFGVKELDESLNGVIRRGSVYMISGKTGVGKTTLCTQFLVQGARVSEKGAIILTDTRGAEYVANAKTFDFGFEGYYKEGTIEVIELSDRIRDLKQDAMDSLKNRNRYISRLTGEIRKIVIESNISRLAIDPITPMLIDNDDFVNQFFMSLAIPHTFLIVTSPVMRSDVSVFGIEEYFTAGVIKMDIEDLAAGLRRTVIVKMRGGSYGAAPFYFKITSKGIVPANQASDSKLGQIF